MTDRDLTGWRGTTHPGRLGRLHGGASAGGPEATDDLVDPSRPLVSGRPLAPPTRTARLLPRAGVLGDARRRVARFLRAELDGHPERTTARMLALVPAHDDEATIGRTLEALLAQTRLPNRIVVLADDCTDRTEQVARRYRGVTVMRTVGNADGRAGALNQGWRRWQAGHDVVAAVDADTVLAPDCLQQLADELSGTARAGGVSVAEPVDPDLGATIPARLLLRAHRRDLADGVLHGTQWNRQPFTRGGRPVLYSGAALRAVCETHRAQGPWLHTVEVGDRRLAGDLRSRGFRTWVSTAARAHAGPRLTVRLLRDGDRRPHATGLDG